MTRAMGRWRLLANAGFAALVLALGAYGLFQVASRRWQVQPTFHVRARFPSVVGVEAGHRVRFQGIDAGVVEAVSPPSEPGEPVELALRIDARLRRLVRVDTTARIIAEGMIGARVVDLKPGAADAEPAADGGLIRSETPVELSDLIEQAGGSLREIDRAARAAQKGLEEVATIAGGVRQGRGSLGRLIHDDSVYDNLAALTKRGDRTVGELEDSLMALKQTWPLSRYFDARAYLERDRVLYHPGATRESRSLRAEDLFEPGRALLTPTGKTRLDDVAKWFNKSSQPRSEVVVAAFTDAELDADLAEALTQEQADAVSNYLIERHGINSAGWFKKRKVAAVGFGGRPPRLGDDQAAGAPRPARRVDVIVFTPQI